MKQICVFIVHTSIFHRGPLYTWTCLHFEPIPNCPECFNLGQRETFTDRKLIWPLTGQLCSIMELSTPRNTGVGCGVFLPHLLETCVRGVEGGKGSLCGRSGFTIDSWTEVSPRVAKVHAGPCSRLEDEWSTRASE